MKMLFSELCEKEVINCAAAKSLGFVCDASFDAECGKIIYLLVKPDNGILCFKKSEPICVPWDKIERIGDDFIIVKEVFGLNFDSAEQCCDKKNDGFKLFFSK